MIILLLPTGLELFCPFSFYLIYSKITSPLYLFLIEDKDVKNFLEKESQVIKCLSYHLGKLMCDILNIV